MIQRKPYEQDEKLKKCKRCGESKERSNFNSNPIARDRLHVWCKKCCSIRREETRKLPEHRFGALKMRAKNHKFPLTISFEEFRKLAELPCYYCHGYFGHVKYGSGLDRIDNSKGYEVSNVLPCCEVCNKTRNTNFTVEETIVIIKTVIGMRTANNDSTKAV